MVVDLVVAEQVAAAADNRPHMVLEVQVQEDTEDHDTVQVVAVAVAVVAVDCRWLHLRVCLNRL